MAIGDQFFFSRNFPNIGWINKEDGTYNFIQILWSSLLFVLFFGGGGLLIRYYSSGTTSFKSFLKNFFSLDQFKL